MVKVPMPKSLLKPIQSYLQNKEKQLNARKKALADEDPFADPDRLNDNAAIDTEAAEQFGHERVVAMRREIDKALINVRKSLTKIKLGKYGVCENCKKMIDTNRLAIDPTVQLCMKCEQKKEAASLPDSV